MGPCQASSIPECLLGDTSPGPCPCLPQIHEDVGTRPEFAVGRCLQPVLQSKAARAQCPRWPPPLLPNRRADTLEGTGRKGLAKPAFRPREGPHSSPLTPDPAAPSLVCTASRSRSPGLQLSPPGIRAIWILVPGSVGFPAQARQPGGRWPERDTHLAESGGRGALRLHRRRAPRRRREAMAGTGKTAGVKDVTSGGLEGGTAGGRAVGGTVPLCRPSRKTTRCPGVKSARVRVGAAPAARMPRGLPRVATRPSSESYRIQAKPFAPALWRILTSSSKQFFCEFVNCFETREVSHLASKWTQTQAHKKVFFCQHWFILHRQLYKHYFQRIVLLFFSSKN